MTESREIPENYLSLDEFRKRNSLGLPKYGNFRVFFKSQKKELDKSYENNVYFKQFKRENLELFKEMDGMGEEIFELEDIINIYEERSQSVPQEILNKFEEIETKFHKAYLIMKSYGATDTDLLT